VLAFKISRDIALSVINSQDCALEALVVLPKRTVDGLQESAEEVVDKLLVIEMSFDKV
jgi:hypothetical protein